MVRIVDKESGPFAECGRLLTTLFVFFFCGLNTCACNGTSYLDQAIEVLRDIENHTVLVSEGVRSSEVCRCVKGEIRWRDADAAVSQWQLCKTNEGANQEASVRPGKPWAVSRKLRGYARRSWQKTEVEGEDDQRRGKEDVGDDVRKKRRWRVPKRRRKAVRYQRRQSCDRFWVAFHCSVINVVGVGRQIAYMVYEHFRGTGAHEAGQGLSDLLSTRLQNDDVQGFDVRWDQALLSGNETPTEMMLEGLLKSNLQDWVTKKLFETTNNHAIPDWRHQKDVMLIKRWERGTSESRTKLWREERQPRAKKKEKLSLKGKWENAISGKQLDNVLRRLM